jgi:hypothetical protein
MKRAYRVARELLWQRLDETAPGTTKILQEVHQADLIVVQGKYDHIEAVLESAGMPFSVINAARLEKASLRPDQIVFVNCPGVMSSRTARKLRDFVGQGGFLFTTSWALRHVLEPAFPGYVEYNEQPTGDEVVRIEILDRYGEAPVFISFEYGQGLVYPMISHFYLQRAETRTARHAKPGTDYVLSKGVQEGELWRYKQLGAAGCTPARSCGQPPIPPSS